MPQVAAAAAPALISGGIGLLANRPSKTQRGLEQEQLNALRSQTQLAGMLKDYAKSRYELSQPAYTKAMGYYQSLLSGNAAQRQQTLAPDIRRLTEGYRGAETSISNRLTGAARDRELAELKRQQVGQIGELGAAPRQGAAATLLGTGQQDFASLLSALQGAGGLYGSAQSGSALAGQMENERRRMASDLGAEWAKTFLPQLIAAFGNKGKLPKINTSLLPSGGGFIGG